MKFKLSYPFFVTERAGARMTEEDSLFYSLDRSKWVTIVILVVLLVLTTLSLYTPKWSNTRLLYQEDLKHSAVEIVADCNFSFVDKDATLAQRERFVKSFPFYLKIDDRNNQLLRESFLSLTTAFAHGNVDSLCSTFLIDYPIAQKLKTLFAQGSFQEHFLTKVTQLLARGVIDIELQASLEPLHSSIIIQDSRELPLRAIQAISTPKVAADVLAMLVLQPYQWGEDPQLNKALASIVEAILSQSKGNLSLDSQYRSNALSKCPEMKEIIQREVAQGETIIRRNQLVMPRHLDMLEAYRTVSDKTLYSLEESWRIAELAFLALMLIGLVYVYLSIIATEITQSNRKLLSFVVVLSISMSLNAFIVLYGGPFLKNFNIPLFSYDLLPLALAPALATVILGVRVGVIAGIYVTVISAFQLENNFSLLLGGIFISYIMSFSIRRTSNYRSYFMRILFIVIVISLLMKVLEYVVMSHDVYFSGGTFAALCINGVMTATFALLTLFFMELLLGVTTDMSLQALIATDNPLLYRLQMEANGTYIHSVSVATIAEQAAIEVGASPIQTRVAALYHDIGKLSAPEYFAENTNPNETPYAKLSPSVSAIRIINHVKHGLDIAIRQHLPKIVRDAISQHHGTDLVSFFYSKALEEEECGKGAIDRKIFSYPGPRPRQKEIVIVSLADACEAATRSIEKPTHAKIEAMVTDIIRTKMKNRQLDQANITIGELSKIHASFVKTLTSQHHSRITYPKMPDDEDVTYTVISKQETRNKERN